jgi:hypothetical protein
MTSRDHNITREFETISALVARGDEARLRAGLESVRWRRRGVLGRLVLAEEPAPRLPGPKAARETRQAA